MDSQSWPCLSFLEGRGGFFSLPLYSGAYIRKVTLQVHCGHIEQGPLASPSWKHPTGQAAACLPEVAFALAWIWTFLGALCIASFDAVLYLLPSLSFSRSNSISVMLLDEDKNNLPFLSVSGPPRIITWREVGWEAYVNSARGRFGHLKMSSVGHL